ncbi:MAG: c-type cytochrome, partial [Myxococcales bacterium]|nr:c-type cytochrome [Myxococcales bacterium]
MIQRRSMVTLGGLGLAAAVLWGGAAVADSPYPWLRDFDEHQDALSSARGADDAAPADHLHEPPHGGQIVKTHAFVAEVAPTETAFVLWALGDDWKPIQATTFQLEGELVPYGGRRVKPVFERVDSPEEGTRWVAPFDAQGPPGFHATLYLSSGVATERLEILYDPYGVLARYGFTERLVPRGHPGFEPFQIEWGRRLVTELHCAACHAVAEDALPPNRSHPVALHPGHGTVGPRLDDAGAKLRPEWLFAYLSRPTTIRRWIPARMPDDGLRPNEALDITAYLATERLTTPDEKDEERDPGYALVERGRAVWEQSRCATCHRAQGNPTGESAEAIGPAPEVMGPRLQPAWAFAWIRDPGRIVPGTPMPSYFFSGGEPLYDRAEADAEAVASFVLSHRDAALATDYGAAARQWGPGDARRGKAMIEARRCAACHDFG